MEKPPTLGALRASDKQLLSKSREREGSDVEKPPLRCLLCQLSLKDRDSLNKHYRNVHLSDFSEPLLCPECPKGQVAVVLGWNEWAAHIEDCHGLDNAPTRKFNVGVKRPCLLCSRSFASSQGLSSHVARQHGRNFEHAFPCPECRRQKLDDCMISSLPEWCSHVALSHRANPAPALPATRKHRCLVCEAEVVNERGHYNRHHSHLFDKPFGCPECGRQGAVEVPILNSCHEWQLHCAVVHRRTAHYTTPTRLNSVM